tara:strand:- start:313 stop:663 length:351 start_codon:yes stop_codon:yes gene_type:complete
MCFFGGAKAAPAPKKPEFEDAPPIVTGEQTGVDKPKNTAKATEKLRMMRKKKEGTYVDPTVNTNLDRTTSLLTRSSGGGNKTAQQKANLARNKAKAKSLAKARMNNKSMSRAGGRV